MKNPFSIIWFAAAILLTGIFLGETHPAVADVVASVSLIILLGVGILLALDARDR